MVATFAPGCRKASDTVPVSVVSACVPDSTSVTLTESSGDPEPASKTPRMRSRWRSREGAACGRLNTRFTTLSCAALSGTHEPSAMRNITPPLRATKIALSPWATSMDFALQSRYSMASMCSGLMRDRPRTTSSDAPARAERTRARGTLARTPVRTTEPPRTVCVSATSTPFTKRYFAGWQRPVKSGGSRVKSGLSFSMTSTASNNGRLEAAIASASMRCLAFLRAASALTFTVSSRCGSRETTSSTRTVSRPFAVKKRAVRRPRSEHFRDATHEGHRRVLDGSPTRVRDEHAHDDRRARLCSCGPDRDEREENGKSNRHVVVESRS